MLPVNCGHPAEVQRSCWVSWHPLWVRCLQRPTMRNYRNDPENGRTGCRSSGGFLAWGNMSVVITGGARGEKMGGMSEHDANQVKE